MGYETILVKLTTGELVIGKIYNNSLEFLEDVYLVLLDLSSDGGIDINIAPYMSPFDNKGTILNGKRVMWETQLTPPLELVVEYNKAISGIIIQTNKIQT